VKTVEQDLLELLDHAWDRLNSRMGGLTDEERSWHPIAAGTKVSIRW